MTEQRKRDIGWLNLFIRDLLLVAVVGLLQWQTDFKSRSLFLITGMLLVWITWQITDYLNYKRLQQWKSEKLS